MKLDKERVYQVLSEQMLTIATLGSVVVGVVVGLIVRASSTSKWTDRELMYLNFIGELFLRMLKSLILPLIISSLIAAIGTLNLKSSGKIGGRAISYYMITTVMAGKISYIIIHKIRTQMLTYPHCSDIGNYSCVEHSSGCGSPGNELHRHVAGNKQQSPHNNHNWHDAWFDTQYAPAQYHPSLSGAIPNHPNSAKCVDSWYKRVAN